MKSPSNHNRDEERKSSGDKDQKEKSDDGHNDGRGKELKTGTSPAENHGREKKSPRGGSPISFINNKRPVVECTDGKQEKNDEEEEKGRKRFESLI
eukprot:jgi/Bigna1/133838/aug1.22_g8546